MRGRSRKGNCEKALTFRDAKYGRDSTSLAKLQQAGDHDFQHSRHPTPGRRLVPELGGPVHCQRSSFKKLYLYYSVLQEIIHGDNNNKVKPKAKTSEVRSWAKKQLPPTSHFPSSFA